jgi:hypothetical protein
MNAGQFALRVAERRLTMAHPLDLGTNVQRPLVQGVLCLRRYMKDTKSQWVASVD